MLNAPEVHEVRLAGREHDLAGLRAVVAGGGTVVVASAPGEGRTALLRAVAARRRVVAVPGLADEAAVPWAGLQRLLTTLGVAVPEMLAPVLTGGPPLAGALPAGLALATVLRTATNATGIPDDHPRRRADARPAEGRPGESRLVGDWPGEGYGSSAGVLLLLADDADRLDAESWQVVKIAVRRLDGVPVALLASVTADATGHAAADGLPVHVLSALDDRASRSLLSARVPDLAPETVAALTRLAAGNPGALVELAGTLTPAQRRGLAAPPETLPPAGALAHRLRTAVAALPGSTRDALLLAATADPDTPPADLLAGAEASPAAPVLAVGLEASPADLPPANAEHAAAAASATDTAGDCAAIAFPATSATPRDLARDLEAAERAGLLDIGRSRIRFRPAILRAVVYHDASLARRRAAHLTLAAMLAARGRHLPALLHRASVAAGPDDALARELTAAAAGAAPRLAASAQRHAGELSGDPTAAAGSLLAAAGSAWLAGQPHEAVRLLRWVARTPASATVRARARSLTAEMEVRGVPAAARDALLAVAAELLPHDPAGAVEALQLAAEAIARTGEPGEFPALARRAVAARPDDDRPGQRLARHHLAGLADLMTGSDESGFGHLRSMLDLAARVDDPAALIRAATAGILVGQDHRAALTARRAASLARTAGAVALVPAALEVAAYAGMAAGHYAAATDAALDGEATARRAGRTDLADTHGALLTVLAALLGEGESATGTGLEVSERRPGRGDGDAAGLREWAAGLLDLIDGNPRTAAERLGRLVTGGSMLLRVAATPHLVEAVALAEGTAGPSAGAAVFDRWAGRTGQREWLALRDRCRALRAGDPEAADHHFRQALGRHREDGTEFARAHTELLYGRYLRRRRRPAEAREHLRRAAGTFHRLDAVRWAEQTVRELRAAGERAPGARPAPLELTAQQERIAGLVAEGATNREVAERLHLSPRTVDHHLRNVFARLGVRSRTELARLLAG